MKLEECIPPEIIKYNEPMANHTTFGIGGPVDYLLEPRSIDEITAACRWARENEVPYMFMGAGSNLLVKDGGIRGLVIKIGKSFSRVEFKSCSVRAQAGVMIGELSRMAAGHGLSGLEFAEGIPGTLGGAVYMNAGAYGGETCQVLAEVKSLTRDMEVNTYYRDSLEFGYRSSPFQKNGELILEAVLDLKPDAEENIWARMNDYSRQRSYKQPLEYPSAGSVFKRPEGFYVGPLIEELGLKGYRIGDAQISSKHAGFIINVGQATARQVLDLISLVQAEAKSKKGMTLEPEIRIIGED